MFEKLLVFLKSKNLIINFLVVVLGLIVFRVITSVPLPQVDVTTLTSLIYSNQLLGVFNIFSGGGLSNFSIGMLGVFPYITVSIIVIVLTAVSPKINSLYNEEGEIGRNKIKNWTRIATVPVAAMNATGLLLYLKAQGFLPIISTSDFISMVILIVAGSLLAMWIGELITEFGIGNGISLMIFAGIVVNIPVLTNQAIITFSPSVTLLYAFAALAGLVFVLIAVYMNEADRPVPMSYVKFGSGFKPGATDTYIPIKVNPVGVLSIIFSLAIMGFFQFLFSTLSNVGFVFISAPALFISNLLANGYYYAIPAGLLTFAFTYFFAPFVFNIEKISTNLSNQGVFIPGIRPGEETKKYLAKILNRVALYSAIFLTFVTIIPFLVTGSTAGTFIFAIGGTGLLIIVSVVLDIYKQLNARLLDLI